MKCPICGNEHTGKLSKSRYFCSNCFVEIFLSKKNKLELLKISEDGSTYPIYANQLHKILHKKATDTYINYYFKKNPWFREI